jgi:thiamine-phosphate pyrophosphorylase
VFDLGESCQLYIVTPPSIDLDDFSSRFEAALDRLKPACVQLRLPDADEAAWREAIERLCPMAQGRDIAFLLSEKAELAVEYDCDGVHVGEGKLSVRAARDIVGPDRSVGVSCGASRHAAMQAAEDGADYVSFGPFFPSPTKPHVTDLVDIEILEIWSETTNVPCVAIGGVTPDNARRLADAGADFVAVVSGVWDAA